MTGGGHVLVGFEALAVSAASYMGVPLRLVSITSVRAPTLSFYWQMRHNCAYRIGV